MWSRDKKDPGSIFQMPDVVKRPPGEDEYLEDRAYVIEECIIAMAGGWTLHLRPLNESEKMVFRIMKT